MSRSIKLKDNIYLDQTTIKHDYIKVRQTISQKQETAGTLEVLFQEVDINVGDGFELLTNGKVSVKTDKIHHVRITSWIWVERKNSYAWCHLSRNGNDICSQMIPNASTGEVWETIQMTTITPVSKYDQIFPYIYFNVGESSNKVNGGVYGNSVAMIVEAID